MALQEALNLPCPFAGQQRADGVNQPPSRPNQLGSDIERRTSGRGDRGVRASVSSASGCDARAAAGAGASTRRHPPPRATGKAPRAHVGGLRSRVSTRAPALPARSGSIDKRARLLSVARMCALGAAAARASDFLPHRRKVYDPLLIARIAGKRDQLATLILHLDKAALVRPDSSTRVSNGSRIPQDLAA